MRMRYCVHLALVIFLTSSIPTTRCRSSKKELTPEMIQKYSGSYAQKQNWPGDCDSGKIETEKYQRWLFTMYRGLWEYRKTGHQYDKHLGEKDLEDNPLHHGSVILINWQDSTLHLMCPCSNGTKVDNWKMYGKGSDKFNHQEHTKNPLKTKVPSQRNYYRSFSCTVGSHVHFFNVFTRPLGVTSLPPLMFTERIPGPSDSRREIDCTLSMYLEQKRQRFAYIPAPFQFYWQFPPSNEKLKQSVKREQKMRPSPDDGNDNLFWDKQVFSSGRTILAHQCNDTRKLEVKSGRGVNVSSICKANSSDSINSIVLSTTMKISAKFIRPHHAGLYSCIVVDVNGLSSAFWWDGDYPPHDAFRGHSYVRVRALVYFYIAAGVFFGLILLLPFAILLPDNKEEFDSLQTPLPPLPTLISPPKSKESQKALSSKVSPMSPRGKASPTASAISNSPSTLLGMKSAQLGKVSEEKLSTPAKALHRGKK